MEIELTIALPCTHFSPASITSHFDESIISGTRAMSGSAAIRFRKVTMTAWLSSSPASIFTSSTWAPASTCCRATLSASEYSPASISFLNFADPVTLVRSPTLMKRGRIRSLPAEKLTRRVAHARVREGIDDAHSGEDCAVVHVFGEQRLNAGATAGGEQKRVPVAAAARRRVGQGQVHARPGLSDRGEREEQGAPRR